MWWNLWKPNSSTLSLRRNGRAMMMNGSSPNLRTSSTAKYPKIGTGTPRLPLVMERSPFLIRSNPRVRTAQKPKPRTRRLPFLMKRTRRFLRTRKSPYMKWHWHHHRCQRSQQSSPSLCSIQSNFKKPKNAGNNHGMESVVFLMATSLHLKKFPQKTFACTPQRNLWHYVFFQAWFISRNANKKSVEERAPHAGSSMPESVSNGAEVHASQSDALMEACCFETILVWPIHGFAFKPMTCFNCLGFSNSWVCSQQMRSFAIIWTTVKSMFILGDPSGESGCNLRQGVDQASSSTAAFKWWTSCREGQRHCMFFPIQDLKGQVQTCIYVLPNLLKPVLLGFVPSCKEGDDADLAKPAKRVRLEEMTPNTKKKTMDERMERKRENSRQWHKTFQSKGVPWLCFIACLMALSYNLLSWPLEFILCPMHSFGMDCRFQIFDWYLSHFWVGYHCSKRCHVVLRVVVSKQEHLPTLRHHHPTHQTTRRIRNSVPHTMLAGSLSLVQINIILVILFNHNTNCFGGHVGK